MSPMIGAWKKALVSPSSTIHEVIAAIDMSAIQIALVVDSEMRLLGTVTDGDVRRGLLNGHTLESRVGEIMNTLPTVARVTEDPQSIFALMKLKQLQQIPIVDDFGRVISVELLADLIQSKERENAVLLMAGGLGSRLAPLTDNCPKPMLKVGGKPLLETILAHFIDNGFRKFYFSVNYMAESIMDHFGDGSRWGVQITYLHEKEKLGTAGAMSLIPDKLTHPLIVMNGDLLTKVNFRQLLEMHMERRSFATMCVREYNFQVPYGVVRIENDRLVGIDEKPSHKFFISAGIYVLNPEIVEELPKATYLNMPELFEHLIAQHYCTTVFPIREYWLDIGQMDDFKRANGDFAEVFK